MIARCGAVVSFQAQARVLVLLLLTVVWAVPRVALAQYGAVATGNGLAGSVLNTNAIGTSYSTAALYTPTTGVMGIDLAGSASDLPMVSGRSLTVRIDLLNAGAGPWTDAFNVTHATTILGNYSEQAAAEFQITGPSFSVPYKVFVTIRYSGYHMMSVDAGNDAHAQLTWQVNPIGSFVEVEASDNNYDDDMNFDGPTDYVVEVELNQNGEGLLDLGVVMGGSIVLESSTTGGTSLWLEAESTATIVKIVGPHGTVNF